MEALKLKTFIDLEQALLTEERLELLNGNIIQQSAPRFEHGALQGNLRDELGQIRRSGNGDKGWWFATEIHVRYNEHNAPCHDIAGWRKQRVPDKPVGVVDIRPDWVCEISSPGHLARDNVSKLNLLQANQVPFYWIINPEEKTVMVYEFADDTYKVIASLQNPGKQSLQPFTEIEFDFDYIFDQ